MRDKFMGVFTDSERSMMKVAGFYALKHGLVVLAARYTHQWANLEAMYTDIRKYEDYLVEQNIKYELIEFKGGYAIMVSKANFKAECEETKTNFKT